MGIVAPRFLTVNRNPGGKSLGRLQAVASDACTGKLDGVAPALPFRPAGGIIGGRRIVTAPGITECTSGR
jgi:hypothetical protein